MTVKGINQSFSIQPTWNDVYKNNDVFSLPWVDSHIKPELKAVIDNLPIKSGNALDIGCGLGQVSRYLAEVGFDVTAIDISEEAIELARALNKTGKNINYQVANSISFTSEKKYDLIIDFLHIHDINVKNIGKYAQNISSLLCKNGYLVIATFSRKDSLKKAVFARKSLFTNQQVYYYSIDYIENYIDNNIRLVDYCDFIAGRGNLTYESYIVIFKNQNAPANERT